MTIIAFHPTPEEQETEIRIFLDELHLDYHAEISDGTKYILSFPKNAAHLQKSIAQAQNGEVVKLNLDDIWKP